MIKQGEKLMLLVRRDPRGSEFVAKAMGYDKSYLPKLYKMEFLPKKPIERAAAVFDVPESYFSGEMEGQFSEPAKQYRSTSARELIEELRTENKKLKAEIEALKQRLEQERLLAANLAEALKNLTK